MSENIKAANVKTENLNKKNLADGDTYKASGDHYNLDWLYILSIISSIILGGFAEAMNKCDTYKGNNPLCIPPEEVIHRKLRSGGGALDTVNKYLDQASNASTQSGDMSALGKFISLVRIINNKFLTIFENASKVVLGVKTAANDPHMEQDIIAFLDENKEMIKKMTRDPEVQAALREWVEEMGVLNIQLMDMAKPIIERLSNEFIASINKAAVKATQGIISTSFNIVEAAIGEIPVAGGIIDLILDVMRGFNSAMQAAGPIVEFTTEAFFRALRTIFTTFTIINEKSSDIQRAVNKVEGALNNTSIENLEEKGQLTEIENAEDTSISTEKDSGASKGGGQVKKQRANIQKRIKHVTHRLRKTIRKFMRKTKKYRL